MKKTVKKKTKKPVKKKTTVKKAPKKKAAKKAVAKKRPVKRKQPVKKPVAVKPVKRTTAPKPLAPSMTKPSSVAPAGGQLIGKVVHYYTELSVAIVELTQGTLRVGETIQIKGHTTDFKQPVESMEIEHQKVMEAAPGQSFGLKVREHAREHDAVYKVKG
jgi:putative protease